MTTSSQAARRFKFGMELVLAMSSRHSASARSTPSARRPIGPFDALALVAVALIALVPASRGTRHRRMCRSGSVRPGWSSAR
jgi:hypothetical protein